MWIFKDGLICETDAEWSDEKTEVWTEETVVNLLNNYEEMIDKKQEMIERLTESLESTERSRQYWINQYNELVQSMIDRDIELV